MKELIKETLSQMAMILSVITAGLALVTPIYFVLEQGYDKKYLLLIIPILFLLLLINNLIESRRK